MNIGFDSFDYSRINLENFSKLKDAKLKDGINATNISFRDTLEDTAVFSKVTLSNSAEKQNTPNFDFTNMTRNEMLVATSHLYSIGVLTKDELVALQVGTEYSPATHGLDSPEKFDYTKIFASMIVDQVGLTRSESVKNMESALVKILEFSESQNTVNEPTRNKDGSNTGTEKANSNNFDFANMTYDEWLTATSHLYSIGVLTWDELVTIQTMFLPISVTGHNSATHGLDSPEKFDYISMFASMIADRAGVAGSESTKDTDYSAMAMMKILEFYEESQILSKNVGNTDTGNSNSNYGKKIDFTNISGDELLEWLNAGLKSGEIPHAGSSVWLIFASQNGRMNLMAKLQSAAAHARSVGHSSADSFDWMLEFVQKKQG